MSVVVPTRITPDVLAPSPALPQRPTASRWLGLDALKALAIFGVVTHHLAAWTGGRVRDRWIGFDELVLTDLSATAFALGLGVGAHLVGSRLADRGRPGREMVTMLWRWVLIGLVAVAIDVVNGSWIDGGGVLYTLAVLGLVITLAVSFGLRAPWAWWLVALAAATLSGPIVHGTETGHGVVSQLWSGPFAVVTYATFAAVGAAVVAHPRDKREASIPLVRAALGIVGVGLALAAVLPETVPDGLWPPRRYPGDLAFTVWGTAGTLLIWAGLRATLRRPTWLTRALARAASRTLWIFALHFAFRVALQRTGRIETLTTWRWGLVAWATAAVVCVVASIDWRGLIAARRPEPADA